MINKFNILLTSVGRRSYLVKYFKQALGELGEVHVSNRSDMSPAFEVADAFVVTPLIYDKNYIPFLLDYCRKNQIGAIISLFDVDLPILSKNKKLFKEYGIDIVVSSPEVIEICNDKWKTYNFLVENKIETPATFISFEEAIQALKNEEIKFPLMVKPRWGMGSIAVFEAENEEELEVFYNKVKRNIVKTYLKYESINNLNESVLIQQKLEGQEYGLDIVNDLDKNYQTTIVKMKYAMRSGETDCAITVKNEDLKRLGRNISQKLKHVANLDVDVFVEENKAYVLEMNARFGGGYPFSHMAGVNLPVAIVSWLQGKEISSNILSERYNVITQKDISLVEMNAKKNKDYKK